MESYRKYSLLLISIGLTATTVVVADVLDQAREAVDLGKKGLKKAEKVAQQLRPIIAEARKLEPQVSPYIAKGEQGVRRLISVTPELLASLEQLSKQLDTLSNISAAQIAQGSIKKASQLLKQTQGPLQDFDKYATQVVKSSEMIRKLAPDILSNSEQVIIVFQKINPILQKIMGVSGTTLGIAAKVRDAGRGAIDTAEDVGRSAASTGRSAAREVGGWLGL